jgi:hypothetical protein
MIMLLAATCFFVLGIAGTVSKLLFDDWQVRQALRIPVRLTEEPPKTRSDER